MRPSATKLDRYPAKMVSRLAVKLVSRYAGEAERILDPFCGSGAILGAAQEKGIPVSGVDINPYAVLLSGVKLSGFSGPSAGELCAALIDKAKCCTRRLPIEWESKTYWFTAATLEKYERLRFNAASLKLSETPEGRAVLLAIALSVRLCSRSDQRSPKPFISKTAIVQKKGRHLDPYRITLDIFEELNRLYGRPRLADARILSFDLACGVDLVRKVGPHSHVITSPPYINAQDYFRNFKLELYVLEGLLPFSVDSIKGRFIGTERGLAKSMLEGKGAIEREKLVPGLRNLQKTKPHLACVVHRYLDDMDKVVNSLKSCLLPDGVLVVVCGDNLVGGMRIRTWKVIGAIIEKYGFSRFDRFGDKIACRALAPTRLGHKGIIKEEIVSAFRRR